MRLNREKLVKRVSEFRQTVEGQIATLKGTDTSDGDSDEVLSKTAEIMDRWAEEDERRIKHMEEQLAEVRKRLALRGKMIERLRDGKYPTKKQIEKYNSATWGTSWGGLLAEARHQVRGRNRRCLNNRTSIPYLTRQLSKLKEFENFLSLAEGDSVRLSAEMVSRFLDSGMFREIEDTKV